MVIPSIEKLSNYLGNASLPGSMVLTSCETDEIDQALPWKGEKLPWNGPTCLTVICYAIKFTSNSDNTTVVLNNTIRRLNDLASEYDAAYWKLDGYCNPWNVASEPDLQEKGVMEAAVQEKNQEIADMFVNHFMPEVQELFRVPNVHQLSERDKSLKENEILAGFINFILQILNSESLTTWYEKQKYALLCEELTFLLTFLGDIPFQCTELEEVKNVLAEFETLANEAGGFTYSCVFSTSPVKASRFYGGRDFLLEKIELLNKKVKEHCMRFSELPRSATPRTNSVDSLFIVDSLLEDLESLMNHHHNCTTECKNQLKSLHEELSFTRSFVTDIVLLPGEEMQEAKESQVEIRDAAYEAEYLINSHVARNAPLWYSNLRLPNVVERINAIGIRLQEIKKINDSEVLNSAKDFVEEVSSQYAEPPKVVDDNILEGFKDERTNILADIVGGSDNQTVISIFGMPGLGKTTVAKNLYNNRAIYDRFDERVWCVVSQTYEKTKVLRHMVMSLLGKEEKEEIMKLDDGSLGLKIHKFLKGRRYLIVMDDVWYSNIWGDLIRYFPDDGNGSRIILTSRIRDTAPTGSIFHTLSLLSEAQCWNLLAQKVFPEESCPPQLLGTGQKIVAKCHGLPLAVVVMAGLLANLEKEESVWEKVERNLDSYIFDDPRGCMKILELSYEHLPNHLKPCFLYFGAFPEDTEIPTRKLILMWIAEGFIRKEQDKSPEHIAEEFLTDLINRSLLMIGRRSSHGQIKSFRVHDLLRDMCLRKAYGENFLKSIDENFSIYEKHRLLCVHSTIPSYWRPFSLHCRSFSGCLSDPSSCFPQMPLLRVMELLPFRWGASTVTRINLLVHLRYLVVDEELEPIVSNLVNLEFLGVKSKFICHVPSAILTMVKLRHLHVEKQATLKKDRDNYQTTNLRSLSFVRIYIDKDEEILKSSPHLLMLKCRCAGTIFPDVGFFTQLESLKMVFENPFNGELSKISFPCTIKKLTIWKIGLHWSEMSIVGKLPNLQVLKLHSNAFVGEEWNTTDDEFQELRFLRLEKVDLIKWTAYSEHFPKLESLQVRVCWHLKEIPSDLGNIPTLQTIEVGNSSYEASISAVQIENEQIENGNEELKVIINNYQWSKEQLILDIKEGQGRGSWLTSISLADLQAARSGSE